MLYLRHGGHVVKDEAADAAETVRRMDTGLESKAVSPSAAEPATTPFAYLFPGIKNDAASHLPGEPSEVVAALNALGSAMLDEAPPGDDNSTMPAIYTYWGQFIDHDLTANTDRDSRISDVTRPDLEPVPPDDVTRDLRNLRRPTLDLDSAYGDGPAFVNPDSDDAEFYIGPRFRIGKVAVEGIPGEAIPPVDDDERDLPRIGTLLDEGVITEDVLPEDLRSDPSLRTRAFIGDLRNDENLIVAQLHHAFLRFHNGVVDAIEGDREGYGVAADDEKAVFERAQQIVRYTYQWIVLHDYLETVTLSGTVDRLLVGGLKHYEPLAGGELFAPLEFSVAAFRFGHSMVRGGYDYNRNFGQRLPGQGDGDPLIPFASIDLLFTFTGNGASLNRDDPSKSTPNPFLGQANVLPRNWVWEADRLTNKADADEGHFARKVDTRLAPPLNRLVKEATGPDIQDDADKPLRELLRNLSRRNLLRGYLLSLPTGQAAAAEMQVDALSEAELRQGNTDAVNAALDQGGFVENTPLWFYVLKEAEVRGNGNSLGELGSRIVGETIVGVVQHAPNSYLKADGGWDPSKGVKLPNGDPIVTLRDLLSFTGIAA
jgi:hypothetical protein